MAASSSSSPSLIDDFVRLSKQIALELVSDDIKLLKFLIQDRIPKSKVEEAKTGIQLISLLKEYRLLSENNVDYFIALLVKCRRVDQANKVTEYKKNSVKEVKNARKDQIEERLPAPNMELLYLLFPGQTKTITTDKIEEIKQSICGALEFKVSDIFYINANDWSSGCSRLEFQLPSTNEKLRQLQWDAINKESWLTNLNVIELKVDSKALINLAPEKPSRLE